MKRNLIYLVVAACALLAVSCNRKIDFEYVKYATLCTTSYNVAEDAGEFAIPEYNDLIVETNTMSREMWVRATAFYYMTMAFHGNGLLRAFGIYLFYEKNIPYEKFYDAAIDYF